MDINQFVMTMFKVWLLVIIILAVVCILYNRKFKRDRALTKGSGYTTSLSIIAQWRRTSVSGRIALPVAFLIAAFDVTLFLAAAMLRTLNYNGYELDVAYLFGVEAQNHQNAIEFLNNMAKVFTHELWLFPFVGFLIFTLWELFVVLLLRTGQSFSLAKWLAHHDVDYSLVLADGTDNSVKGKRVARLNNASVIEAGAMNEMPSIKKCLCIRIGILFIVNILMSWLFAKVVENIYSVQRITTVALFASLLLCVLFLITIIFDSVFCRSIRRRIASVAEWLNQLSNSRISDAAYKRANKKVIKGCFLFVLILGLIGGALYVAYTSQELVYTLSEEGDSYEVNLGFVVLRSHVSIPSTYNGKPVTSIKSPKSTCLWVTEVALSEGVTIIEEGAFSRCISLIEVTIPDSVTTIGNAAFADCSDLTSITIPDSVVSIGDYAFADCESLTSVTIGNSVTSISDYAFAGCNDLTSLTIPDSVTSIGDSAFFWCSDLETIIFEGTIAQWSAITFGQQWKEYAPATKAICSDGVVSLN